MPFHQQVSGSGLANTPTRSPGHETGLNGWHYILRWPRTQRTSYPMGCSRPRSSFSECDTSGNSVGVAFIFYCTAIRTRAPADWKATRERSVSYLSGHDGGTRSEARASTKQRGEQMKATHINKGGLERAQPGTLLNPRKRSVGRATKDFAEKMEDCDAMGNCLQWKCCLG